MCLPRQNGVGGGAGGAALNEVAEAEAYSPVDRQPVGGPVAAAAAAAAASGNTGGTEALLSHFLTLFEVRSAEGFLPKANELYLFVQVVSLICILYVYVYVYV